MKYRFIEMLNEFLQSVGRDDLINAELDCHSTIQLELDNMPPINVDMQTDDVILWTAISEYEPVRIEVASIPLLNSILEYQTSCFMPGQPALQINDNSLIMSGILRDEALTEPMLFGASLEEFFDRSVQINKILMN
ncbi:type III secretion system protein [Yersinia ruckeri]|uniref:InvB/SpaK family type III secretion system chaperone n=1 Tax=Yersinia ruckeri TaxID=29486 RepID=UPI00119F4C16|nr:type III secretion system protein [Yersinia ruckeri]EKN3346586.1 type III secretion system protein [Yersinia ruckeri]EKN3361090.1 type III secretion system protein [Yersinia ruckeri]EKN4202333.1 type III secretion system protein [Yersinia ruckeri]EKN4207445.1 type III secretion system protein [Yersinia ruckeri]EKN4706000.1 type III secretion system protein [Yersinia ruckeri]